MDRCTTPRPRGPRGVPAAPLLLLLLASAGHAQGGQDQWKLRDNSFFIEEAFNQEPGQVQSILLGIRWEDEQDDQDRWEARFRQEWPLGSRLHQLSYVIPFEWNGNQGLSDVRLEYRYQALSEARGRPAFAPRLAAILPTAEEDDDEGRGEFGLEVNLPFSKAVRDVYLHLNVGSRSRFSVETPFGTDDEYLWTPFVGGSTILQVRPGFNLLLETLAAFEERVTGPDETDRDPRWLLVPGFRTGWQRNDRQLVFGAAAPIGLTDHTEDWGILVYLSYELPLR